MNRAQDNNGAGNALEQWNGMVLNTLYALIKRCNELIPFLFTSYLIEKLPGYHISNEGGGSRIIKALNSNGPGLRISRKLSLVMKFYSGDESDISDESFSAECLDLGKDGESAWHDALELTVEYIKRLFMIEAMSRFSCCTVDFEEISVGCLRISIISKDGVKMEKCIVLTNC